MLFKYNFFSLLFGSLIMMILQEELYLMDYSYDINIQEAMAGVVTVEVSAFRWPLAKASCPPGEKMLGGGGHCSTPLPQGFVFLTRNYPVNENEWHVACDTPHQQNVIATVSIICQ